MRCPYAFMGAWVLDISIGNPGEHFLPLREHLLGSGIQIGEDFNRNSRVPMTGEIFCTIFLYSSFCSSMLRR
jgi:hypothetical protein